LTGLSANKLILTAKLLDITIEKCYNLTMKTCPKCKEEKPEPDLYERKTSNDLERVREIRNKAARKYRLMHPERARDASSRWKHENPDKVKQSAKITREKRTEQTKQYNANYRRENRDELLEKERLKRLANPEKYRESSRNWMLNNPEKYLETKRKTRKKNHSSLMAGHTKYCKTRRDADPLFKLITNIRTRINRAIARDAKGGTTIALLGCTIEELKKHIESQFQPGMSWGNWNLYGWHIDHRTPIVSFDLFDPEQQKICFHFSNLQPLWAADNLRKRWDDEAMIKRITGQ
jgi:hypothetical protein